MDEREADLAVAADAEADGKYAVAYQLRAKHEQPDYKNQALPELIGKTLWSVVRNKNEAMDFKSVDGKHWRMFYDPDCCAECEIEDVVGDLSDLVGAPIVMAEMRTNSDSPKQQGEYENESFTWTFYKFATTKGYVTIRWYGSSNGYYSESASFVRIVATSASPAP